MAGPKDKLAKKRQQLITRTSTALGIDEAKAVELLSVKSRQSVRLNPLKADPSVTRSAIKLLGVELSKVAWLEEGWHIEGGFTQLRDSEVAVNGAAYIQNAASWIPVVVLQPRPGDQILDMCAAPGGKTSHIAALTHNQASITANDNSRPRLHKLQHNLERLGVNNVEYSLYDASRLAYSVGEETFDKILLDAPCSGEGMMTLDDARGFESWSVAHIKRLQQLQRKLIAQAWQLLKPGGTLVYSTCTMAPEENEAVIDYLLRHNDDVQIIELTAIGEKLENRVAAVTSWNDKQYDPRIASALRLAPSERVEAFFVAKLEKKQ